jgi:hypothetical protein
MASAYSDESDEIDDVEEEAKASNIRRKRVNKKQNQDDSDQEPESKAKATNGRKPPAVKKNAKKVPDTSSSDEESSDLEIQAVHARENVNKKARTIDQPNGVASRGVPAQPLSVPARTFREKSPAAVEVVASPRVRQTPIRKYEIHNHSQTETG